MIAIVDYGLGNIHAFTNIYRKLGFAAAPARSVSELRNASRIILPGVGSFDWAMKRLNESGLRGGLDEAVLEHKKPVLGVCVGMQMMARSSEEGNLSGLGWIDGEVVKFDSQLLGGEIRLPHMGWNIAQPLSCEGLFSGLENPRFYYLHSYYMKPKVDQVTLARSSYGSIFTAAVQVNNICGTQFHPEKSHQCGIKLLQNFAQIVLC